MQNVDPTPLHTATTAYVAALAGGDAARARLKAAIRETLIAQGYVLTQAADRQTALMEAVCDEKNPSVRGLHYEAQDKLRTLHRLIGENQKALMECVKFLDEDDAFEARFTALCAAVKEKQANATPGVRAP